MFKNNVNPPPKKKVPHNYYVQTKCKGDYHASR